MSRARPPALPMWRVSVAAHDVPPRWHVPARTTRQSAPTVEIARETVARRAAIDAGVPPMRSLTALVLSHTTAERADAPLAEAAR